jgi:hypothetical protein
MRRGLGGKSCRRLGGSLLKPGEHPLNTPAPFVSVLPGRRCVVWGGGVQGGCGGGGGSVVKY